MILRVLRNNGVLLQPHLRQSLLPTEDGTATNIQSENNKSVQLLVTGPVTTVHTTEGQEKCDCCGQCTRESLS